MYDSISFDSETSIKNTKKKLEKIFNEYSVGKTVILELKDRLNIIDEEARTVLGEIFTTREAAEIERKRVAGNVKYDTEEEAKQANKELETIEYIKTKSNSDSRLLDKIKTFKELGSIEFTKTQSKEIVLQEEKEIITLYNIKQDQIKEMPRRIVKCLLLIIISSIICIHFLPPMFAGKLFWKVVAVFCVLWVLSSIINMYDELKKDFKLKKELKTINNLISIKGNNIIYK